MNNIARRMCEAVEVNENPNVIRFKKMLQNYNKDNACGFIGVIPSFMEECYCDAVEKDDKEYLIAVADASNNFARECFENDQLGNAYEYQTIAFLCLDSAFHVF